MAIPYNSDLSREQWVKENLLSEAHRQFWLPYTSNKHTSVVYNKMDLTCGSGHTITFDYSGKLTGKMYRGQKYDDANKEIKRKFSDKIVIDEFSLYVDNESKFKGCDIDDLSLTQHMDSIDGLRDLFYRHKDQALFDTAQGIFEAPTHIFNMQTLDYNSILDLVSAAKKGTGLVKPLANGAVSNAKAKKRIPLERADATSAGTGYFWLINEDIATKMKKLPEYRDMLINGDVRGVSNKIFTGALAKINGLLIVEAPVFFGYTPDGEFDIGDTEIQYSGLRNYATKGTVIAWEGQPKFDELLAEKEGGNAEVKVYARTLLLGSGALQVAWGMMPNYVVEWSDYKKTSGSMLEFWAMWKKTKLKQEMGKGYTAKVDGVDFGVIPVDIEL